MIWIEFKSHMDQVLSSFPTFPLFHWHRQVSRPSLSRVPASASAFLMRSAALWWNLKHLETSCNVHKRKIFSRNDVQTQQTYIPYQLIYPRICFVRGNETVGPHRRNRWSCTLCACPGATRLCTNTQALIGRIISLFTNCHTLSMTSVKSRHARSGSQRVVMQFNMVLVSIHPYNHLGMHDDLLCCIAPNWIVLHCVTVHHMTRANFQNLKEQARRL